jgi:hypothetical protein
MRRNAALERVEGLAFVAAALTLDEGDPGQVVQTDLRPKFPRRLGETLV